MFKISKNIKVQLYPRGDHSDKSQYWLGFSCGKYTRQMVGQVYNSS